MINFSKSDLLATFNRKMVAKINILVIFFKPVCRQMATFVEILVANYIFHSRSDQDGRSLEG